MFSDAYSVSVKFKLFNSYCGSMYTHQRYFPPALYTLQEYVPTGGGCFMFMACSRVRAGTK